MQPKLRPIDAQWITHDEKLVLVLRDRLDLSGRMVLVPAALAPLLTLCDGTRDLGRLRASFELRYGLALPPSLLENFVNQLDEALFLDSPRFQAATAEALAEYRAAPFRPLALAGRSYPADPRELGQAFADYLGKADGKAPPEPSLRGLICPHIDYTRGGPVYAQVWHRARAALAEAEAVVVFGTDHMGAPGALTLTQQRYATPWGALPPAAESISALASVLGETEAYAEELHHRGEHSLELALNWLHYTLGERAVPVVPILCGGFQPYVESGTESESTPAYGPAFTALREALAGRRLFVVAAADLAHVGPAFGDERPLGQAQKEELADNDERRLRAACSGEPAAFLDALRADSDRQRVCGLPPIYYALQLMDGAAGEVVAYDQCPADEEGGSLVSVAGVVFR
ncbi:MAG: AmmeMemoRadiSam system protein B [Chloroflexi bacterium]|nr:AmmeMemoRadiSam system protein B [Chloroflexota bacterium]MCL5109463.1 AmmeMemoRadiSam system protein B [Chloroflexota bacterium]